MPRDEDSFIETIIRQAGSLVRDSKPSEGVISKEGRANLLTAADLASEKLIMDAIRENFPNDDILSEETDSDIEDPLQSEHLWVIDPIDGTSNFRYSRNYSAVSIGYVEKGVIIAAAAYDPFNDDLYAAVRGKGAWLNGQKIQVAESQDLGASTVATDNSAFGEGTRHNLELMLKLPETPWYMIRGSAVLAMCDTAAGKIDIYFHTYLKPWDNAAAFLIAEEAGAKITGINGRSVNFMSDNVVIGPEGLVEQLLSHLK